MRLASALSLTVSRRRAIYTLLSTFTTATRWLFCCRRPPARRWCGRRRSSSGWRRPSANGCGAATGAFRSTATPALSSRIGTSATSAPIITSATAASTCTFTTATPSRKWTPTRCSTRPRRQRASGRASASSSPVRPLSSSLPTRVQLTRADLTIWLSRRLTTRTRCGASAPARRLRSL